MSFPGGPAFLAWLLEIIFKSLLLLTAALTLIWFMRRSSAAARHLYLSVAVVLLLALPLVSVILPSWNVGPFANPFDPAREEAVSTRLESVDSQRPPAGAVTPSGPEAEPGRAESSSAGRRNGAGASSWILYAWGAVGAVLILRLLGGKVYGYWIAGRARPVDDGRILDAVARVVRQWGIARHIPVVESDLLNVPFVSGFLRPRLVVPSHAGGWPYERIEAILHHELAHIKRRDIPMQFVAQIACCLYWINPLVWIMERRLFIERERACDDMAISRNIKASEYAGYLMEAMEELGNRRSYVWVTSAMAEGTDFKDRIISVLDPVARRTTPRSIHSALVIGLSILVLLPFSALHPWADVGTAGEESPPAVMIGGLVDDRSTLPEEGPDRKDAPAKSGKQKETQAMLALLDSPDAYWREHAATALGKAGNVQAISPLIELLEDENFSVREHVATALGEIGDRRALPRLIDVMRSDPDARVREHAASAIGMIGGDGAYDSLVDVYENDGNVRLRAHAAHGLGLVGDERALDLLIDGLGSRHEVIRLHCADALGLLGDARAVKHLEKALKDPSRGVRDSARRALEKLGG